MRKMFADELAKNGLTPRMDQAYTQELADLPPQPISGKPEIGGGRDSSTTAKSRRVAAD